MRRESIVAYVMNFIVSSYVYFVAFMLVLYMVSSLIAGIFNMATGLLDIATSARDIISSPIRANLELQLLHTMAFTIVLVKAYKILISYAETRHINIKFLVEISIIGPTIELIFNSKNYPLEVNMLFATFAFLNLVAYLFFYKTLQKVHEDYEKQCAPVKVLTKKVKTAD